MPPTGIWDIPGAYCPMGCGATLHLMAAGICCVASKCPDKGAAQKVLSDQETEHVVVFDEDGFTVRHPLRERVADALLSCQVHGAISCLGELPPDGRYRALLDGNGHLHLTLIADALPEYVKIAPLPDYPGWDAAYSRRALADSPENPGAGS